MKNYLKEFEDHLNKITGEGSMDDLGLRGHGDELDQDDEGGEGFKNEGMFSQLGKILDTQGGADPIKTVKTDDGQEIAVSPDQARMLRMMLSAEGMKPQVKLKFTKTFKTVKHYTTL